MQYNTLSLHHFSSDIKESLKKGTSRGVIFGNFGACNFGDEAILAGELQEIKKIPTVEVAVAARYPSRIQELHKVSAFSLFNPVAYLKSLFLADFFILGGGGLFCKNDSGIRGILFQLYTIFLFLTLPLLLKKHVFVLGLGFYDNAPVILTKIAAFHFRFVKVLAVRDYASYVFLKKQKTKVQLYKDNSFLLAIEKHHSSILQKTKGKITIGLALNKPQTEEGTQKLIQEVTKFIVYNHASSHFAFYTLDFHPYYPSDRKFAKQIIRSVKKHIPTFSYELVKTTVSPAILFSSFTSCTFLITSRLHGSIFAYRLSVPFFAVAYDKKCSSFLDAINHQWTSPENITFSALQNAFQKKVKIQLNTLTQHALL